MSDEENGNTDIVDIDIQELKEQLNLPDNTDVALAELSERFLALNDSFGQLLIYMNLIDERVQRIDGEAIVTTTIHQHVGQDGTAKVHRMRPEAPALDEIRNPKDLVDDTKASKLAKMIVNQ